MRPPTATTATAATVTANTRAPSIGEVTRVTLEWTAPTRMPLCRPGGRVPLDVVRTHSRRPRRPKCLGDGVQRSVLRSMSCTRTHTPHTQHTHTQSHTDITVTALEWYEFFLPSTHECEFRTANHRHGIGPDGCPARHRCTRHARQRKRLTRQHFTARSGSRRL